MKVLKKYLLDILAVVLFAIVSFVYFMPADMDGRILFRHDASAGKGLGHEKELFQQQTGEVSRWTNSVFGGMPTYQMSPSYESGAVLKQAVNAYHLWLRRLCLVCLCIPPGILYLVESLQLPSILGGARLYHLGILLLFLYHHCRRTYLEGDGFGLSSSNDCGYRAGLSR